MRSKMFVEILEESADKSKLLVKNEVYSEPIWVEKVKVNRQNQVIEFILSQETRKQHRAHQQPSAESNQGSSNPEAVVGITSSSASLLEGFLSGDAPTSVPAGTEKAPALTNQHDQSPPWVQAAAASPDAGSAAPNSGAAENVYFSSMTEPADLLVEEEGALPLPESSPHSGQLQAAQPGVALEGAAALESELESLYESSMQSRQKLGAIGRGPVDLEPHMEICDGRLCLIVPWREPITKQQGSIAVASPQSRDGRFSLPAWKLPLLAKQLKDQITTMGHPIYLNVAGFDFFLD